nr:hypothetical protein [Tanacetum cinerariifolium]
MIDELKGKFNGMSIEINKKKELQYLKQVANLSTYPSQHFRSFCYDDDDDYEDTTIPLNENISQETPSNIIAPVLSTLELKDSLIMVNEELSTILKKESDEFIKFSVEDLVPIPRESEDTFGSDSECILPSFTPLFDSNEDECFTPSDDVELPLHHDPSIPKMSIVSILEGFTDESPFEENDDLFDFESKEME